MSHRGQNANSNTLQVWNGTRWIPINNFQLQDSGANTVLTAAGNLTTNATAGSYIVNGQAVTIQTTTGPMTLTSNGSMNVTSALAMAITASSGNLTHDATSGSIIDTAQAITLQTTVGSLALTAGGTGSVGITGSTNVTLTATNGNITRTATSGSITDTAQAITIQTTVGGLTLTAGGTASVNINGSNAVNLNANSGNGDFNVTARNTILSGNLVVNGTMTTVDTQAVLIKDPYINLGQGNTAAGARPVGIVADYLPIAPLAQAVTGAFTATTINVAGLGAVAGNYVMVNGCSIQENNGLFQVLTYADPVLTIATGTADPWVQNTLTAGAASGTVTKMTISVNRVGTDGLWEYASGASSPLTFTDFATGGAASWAATLAVGNLSGGVGNNPTLQGTDYLTSSVGNTLTIRTQNGAGVTDGVLIKSGDSTGGVAGTTIVAAGNSNSAQGGSVTVSAGDNTSNTANGGDINVSAGDGLTGGDIQVTAGNASTGGQGSSLLVEGGTGTVGGDASLRAGDSNAGTGGTATLGAGDGGPTGGQALVLGGLASAGGTGGLARITGGNVTAGGNGALIEAGGASAASGGTASVLGGQATGAGAGGNIAIVAGDSNSGPGGPITIVTGASTTNAANGGNLAISTGSGLNGGDISFVTGNGATTGNGGDITFNAGSSGGGTGVGGAVTLAAGSGTSGGGAQLSLQPGSTTGGGSLTLVSGGGAVAGNVNIIGAGGGSGGQVLIQSNGGTPQVALDINGTSAAVFTGAANFTAAAALSVLRKNAGGTSLEYAPASSVGKQETVINVSANPSPSAATLEAADITYACDVNAGGFTVTLPSGCANGTKVRVKDRFNGGVQAGTNNITISASGGETIDGTASQFIAVNYGSMTFIKGVGTDWLVV